MEHPKAQQMKNDGEQSFASKLKNELCSVRSRTKEEAAAALSGFFLTAGALRIGHSLALTAETESNAVAKWVLSVCDSFYPELEGTVSLHERSRLGKNKRYRIVLTGTSIRDCLKEWGILSAENDGFLLDTIPRALTDTDMGARCFLRGAFLGVGTVSDPEKSYQLEFVLSREEMGNSILELLQQYELPVKQVLRKGFAVVYLKESDKISELIGMMGGSTTLTRFEQARVYKDLRNHLNRQVNFETANLDKTADAAVRQTEDIRFLMAETDFTQLPEGLQQMAHLRVNNPDATLVELGEMMNPPLGKSGVNHRLRKLTKLADELREAEKNDE